MANGLKTCIDTSLHENRINLQFNIDGIPLYNSSNKQFWPILCKVFFIPDVYKPFPVGIFYGSSKPPLDLFLADFINEINNFHEHGITINGKDFEVHVQSFICDSPARSYLKNVKGHGGYNACERCNVNGLRYQRRTIYPVCESPARTNESFRTKECEDHHNGDTPLVNIIPHINVVADFIALLD